MRSFDPTDPGASYRVRITYASGRVRLCGPWERLSTAKSIRTREVNRDQKYTSLPEFKIASAVIERATGWEAVE